MFQRAAAEDSLRISFCGWWLSYWDSVEPWAYPVQSGTLKILKATQVLPACSPEGGRTWKALIVYLFMCLLLTALGLPCGAEASHCSGFSCLEAGASHRASLSSCGAQLSYYWHVGSSTTRDRTHVPWIGRWIPNHWTTLEVLWLYSWYQGMGNAQRMRKRKTNPTACRFCNLREVTKCQVLFAFYPSPSFHSQS